MARTLNGAVLSVPLFLPVRPAVAQPADDVIPRLPNSKPDLSGWRSSRQCSGALARMKPGTERMEYGAWKRTSGWNGIRARALTSRSALDRHLQTTRS